jgi:hypothetical protein
VVTVARARGWVEPSYDIVYSVIREFEPALVTLDMRAPESTPIHSTCSIAGDVRSGGAVEVINGEVRDSQGWLLLGVARFGGCGSTAGVESLDVADSVKATFACGWAGT